MAPPRRKKAADARKRDYKAEYARRNALARRRGFRDYYEQRTRQTPGASKPGPADLAARRGHASRSDFLRALREGDLILCDITSVTFNQTTKRYGPIWKTVIPASGRHEREYVLRNQTRRSLLETIDAEIAKGVIFSPSPSMDQRRLASGDDVEGGY